MRVAGTIRRAVFLARPNRFVALCGLSGRTVRCHLANSGRLRELLRPGAQVYLRDARKPGRSTAYDLVLVKARGVLVSVDARVPNALFEEEARMGGLRWLGRTAALEASPAFASSRFDFLARAQGRRPLLVETKSCTRVENGTALFPDARTARGARQMADLVKAVGQGYRAAVVFVVQREDARRFSTADSDDPAFGRSLREARRAGVEVHAHRCHVTLRQVRLGRPVPVALRP